MVEPTWTCLPCSHPLSARLGQSGIEEVDLASASAPWDADGLQLRDSAGFTPASPPLSRMSNAGDESTARWAEGKEFLALVGQVFNLPEGFRKSKTHWRQVKNLPHVATESRARSWSGGGEPPMKTAI